MIADEHEPVLVAWTKRVHDAKESEVPPPFPSWQAYITDVLEKDRPLLHRTERQPISKMLSTEGLSIPAIAKILHVSVGTAWNDIDHGGGRPDKGVSRPLSARATALLDKVRAEMTDFDDDELREVQAALNKCRQQVRLEISHRTAK